jgi:DNA-binding NtrC family response regulator
MSTGPGGPDLGGTDLLPIRVSEFRYRRFRLRVVDGQDRGKVFVATGSEMTVGTAPGNDLVVTDPTVSRHHGLIQATVDGFLLRDLDSTNGCTLAGYKVGWAYLKSGAVIGMGATLFRFDALEEELGEPLSEEDHFGRLFGNSLAMRRIFAVLPRIAASDSTVLIEGETGTGKGLLAEDLHRASPRASGPFVVIDCGAIPPNLIESELFGHARGAFTGAHATRVGAFEAAQGGTVFLDEIGELPVAMQPNLLRALEERVIRRVGTVEPIRLNVRILAATHKDLRDAVNRRTFRSDLYYRLNVVRVTLPPLRERLDDIPLLIKHFYEQLSGGSPSAFGAPPVSLEELVAALAPSSFPGNVRELRSAVERALLMGDPAAFDEPVSSEAPFDEGAAVDLFDPRLSFRAAKERAVMRWERWYLRELMQRAEGNLSRAARDARMDRTHLRELLQRYRTPVRDGD